jgi:hypothetical protein
MEDKADADEEEAEVKEDAKVDDDEAEPYPDIVYGAPVPEKLSSDKMEKKMKKIIKEGGKRGVEIEGAADMGGLQFFCTTMQEPGGDVDLLYECLKAMNAKSDPNEEERKGGSGRVGKMLVSTDQDNTKMALVAYCPPAKHSVLTAEKWMMDMLIKLGGGEIFFSDATTAKLEIKNNPDKGLFVLKLKDAAITESINYLKILGLFPDSKDDEDSDYVFGDDDFPTADNGEVVEEVTNVEETVVIDAGKENVGPKPSDPDAKPKPQGPPLADKQSNVVTEPKKAPGAETKKGKTDYWTVVWHWGYPKESHLPDPMYFPLGPEWYIFHPPSYNEAKSIYDSINSRLGHHENRASRAIFSPEGDIVDTWAFDENWAENLKNFDKLKTKGWQPHEENGIWH